MFNACHGTSRSVTKNVGLNRHRATAHKRFTIATKKQLSSCHGETRSVTRKSVGLNRQRATCNCTQRFTIAKNNQLSHVTAHHGNDACTGGTHMFMDDRKHETWHILFTRWQRARWHAHTSHTFRGKHETCMTCTFLILPPFSLLRCGPPLRHQATKRSWQPSVHLTAPSDA